MTRHAQAITLGKGLWRICSAAWLASSAVVVSAMALGGCTQTLIERVQAQARYTLEQRYTQELENIAMFRVVPEGLPHYVRILRGTVELKQEPNWSVGTDTWIRGATHAGIVWEISAVSDPGDLQRLRLLFQWVTRYIAFDAFEQRWNEIEDQPAFGADGKQLFDGQGRPVLRPVPVPISGTASRDWYTTDGKEAVAGFGPGEFGSVKVWIKDVSGAVMFTLAVDRSIPNTRRPPGLLMPGR